MIVKVGGSSNSVDLRGRCSKDASNNDVPMNIGF